MHYVGVDVSSATLEVAEARGVDAQSFPNTKGGTAALVRWLQRRFAGGKCQVILEPTSTYHELLVEKLNRSDIAYTLVNPSRTAAYARARGRRAKTDRVDARLLADLGERERPERTTRKARVLEALKALCRYRNWVDESRRAALNKLETAERSPTAPKPMLDSLRRMIAGCQKEARRLEQEVERLAASDARLAKQARLAATVPGIGRRTALMLLAEMPEVARCESARTWVAFAGLNPEPRESGKMHYSRLSRMGSARIRSRLWMAALVAQRWNPAVAALVERLKERGKTGKLAVTAAMSKLVRIVFGVLKSGRPFDPTLHEWIGASRLARRAAWDMRGRDAHFSPPHDSLACARAHRRPERRPEPVEGRSGGPA